MATTTTKGIVVSFGNTPQAKDDDNLKGVVADDLGSTVYLDVMGNDLGGKAKTLFSLDDGVDNSNSKDPQVRPMDLLNQDTAGVSELSAKKAKIWITADGKVGYQATAESKAAFQYLADGEVGYDTFIYAIRLANGTLSWAKARVAITGVNDAASFVSGALSGSATEDSNVEATGRLIFSDSDTTQDGLAQTVLNGTASYGTYKVDEDGTWHYALNNGLATVQALADGETKTDTFTVKSLDGTASKVVTITITGTNDGPKITSGAQAGGVIEDDTLTTSGQVTASDVDSDDAVLAYSGHGSSAYGTFTVDSDGTWHYTLKDNAAVQALHAGEKIVEKYTVTATDHHEASDSQEVTITITGTNDGPKITSSAQAGGVVEDDTLTTSGQVTASDVDNDDAVLAYSGDGSSAYGTFTVDSDGKWHYTLKDNAAVQALHAGEEIVEKYTVTATDHHEASDSQEVTITITGTNDGPKITSSAQAGSVVEDDTLTTSGQVTASDVDNDDAVLACSGDGSSAYGTFTVDSDGKWHYTLKDNAAVQALRGTQEITETYTVTVTDHHEASDSQEVTITITGTNDTAKITGADGSITEDSTIPVTGKLAITDVDTDENVLGSTYTGDHDGLYGTFHVSADGTWSYDLDNTKSAVQALNNGQTLDDIFTVKSLDGTATHDIKVTIAGVTDAPTSAPPPPVPASSDNDPNDFDTLAAAEDGHGGNNNTDNNSVQDANGLTGTYYLGGGGDRFEGNEADNLIYGGSGNDVIKGNGGADIIYGGSGSDDINGGNGNDIIYGGFGADDLTGGGGDDIFVYLSLNDTNDTIKNFKQGNDVDHVDLTALGFKAADMYSYADVAKNTVTVWHGTATTADFMITLTGVTSVTMGDLTKDIIL